MCYIVGHSLDMHRLAFAVSQSYAAQTTGKYQVLQNGCFYTDMARVETYNDAGNYRELPTSFWYPAEFIENENCPLVVFSHGSFGTKESNETLYRELASHGYVVCAIDHTCNVFPQSFQTARRLD